MNLTPTTADLITAEAEAIALDLLEKELAKENMPLPKGVDQHIQAILANRPDIQETARKRVEARTDAYTQGLKAIGIDLTPIEGIEIDLF